MRLDDLQHKTCRDGGVKRIAASLEHRDPAQCGEPVRGAHRSKGPFDLRSGCELLHPGKGYCLRMNQFFDALGQDWVDAAQRRGAAIIKPALDSGAALQLLELARVAAHTQERRFAPLTCCLAGVAAEQLKLAIPDIDEAALAEFIQEVRQKLEAETPRPT